MLRQHAASSSGTQHVMLFKLRLHFASSSGMQHVMCFLLRLHAASSAGTQHVMWFLLRWHAASSSGTQHVCVLFPSLLFESCYIMWSSQHNSVHVCMGAMVTSRFLVPYNFTLLRLVGWCWNILLWKSSTVLKTLGKVAKQKKAAGCVSFQDAQKMQFFS